MHVQILTKAQIRTVISASCFETLLGVSQYSSGATSAYVARLMSGNAFHRALITTGYEEKRQTHSGKGESKASRLSGW